MDDKAPQIGPAATESRRFTSASISTTPVFPVSIDNHGGVIEDGTRCECCRDKAMSEMRAERNARKTCPKEK
ncbi:hypothetical protein DESC_700110 [Desulfosarcina cetonica]|nr:hypothetical protein DESC_700110 [Desulfosarcina cetonica]